MRVVDYVKSRTDNWGYVLVLTELSLDGKSRVKRVVWSTTGETYRQTDLSPCVHNQTPQTSGPVKIERQEQAPMVREEFLAFDTSSIAILDVDDMQKFSEACPDCDWETAPRYLSRGKRLPHVFVRVPDSEDVKGKKRIAIPGADVLIGQPPWVRVGEDMIDPTAEPIVFHVPLAERAGSKRKVPERGGETVEPKQQPPGTVRLRRQPKRRALGTESALPEVAPPLALMDEGLALIDKTHINQYSEWLKMCTVLKKAYAATDALRLFVKHSRRGDTFESADACKAQFEHARAEADVNLGSLYRLMKLSDETAFRRWRARVHDAALGGVQPFDPRKLRKLCAEGNGAAVHYLARYLIVVKGSEVTYGLCFFDESGRECKQPRLYKSAGAMHENFREFRLAVPGKERAQAVTDAWMRLDSRRVYDRIVYDPGTTFPYEQGGTNVYNLWHGWRHVEEPGFVVDPELIAPLLHHLKVVICDGQQEAYVHYLCLLKLMVMGRKTGVAISSTSQQQGTGKNVWVEYLARQIFGPESIAYMQSLEDLTARFNSLRVGKIMVIADELDTFSGDHRFARKFKSMATSTWTKLERKGKDQINVRDFANYFLLSNQKNLAMVEGKRDRRQMVLWASDVHKGDKGYFNRLCIAMGQDLKTRKLTDAERAKAALIAKHFFHHLLSQDVTSFDPEKIPKTRGRLEGERRHTPAADQFLYWLSSKTRATEEPRKMTDVHMMYQSFCTQVLGVEAKFRYSASLSRYLSKKYSTFKAARTRKSDGVYLDLRGHAGAVVSECEKDYSYDPQILQVTLEEIVEEGWQV